MSVTPSIYVACLAAYNNSILHGTWIDATQEVDEINAAISKMLAASPIENAEEYAIHDYDGFETAILSSYEDIDQVQELALFIEENGLFGAELYNYSSDIEEAKTYLEDNYYGFYESVEDYAREVTESSFSLPDCIKYFIDYESMANDMLLGGEIFTIESDGGYHIFWG